MPTAEQSPPPLRVLVVDADERVCESLAGLIGIGRTCVVVGSASRIDEALALVAAAAPDVLVIDPRLPDADAGRRLIARVRALAPATRVLAMGWSDSVDHDAVAMGADGFIRKTFLPRELVAAVLAAGRRPQD